MGQWGPCDGLGCVGEDDHDCDDENYDHHDDENNEDNDDDDGDDVPNAELASLWCVEKGPGNTPEHIPPCVVGRERGRYL